MAHWEIAHNVKIRGQVLESWKRAQVRVLPANVYNFVFSTIVGTVLSFKSLHFSLNLLVLKIISLSTFCSLINPCIRRVTVWPLVSFSNLDKCSTKDDDEQRKADANGDD